MKNQSNQSNINRNSNRSCRHKRSFANRLSRCAIRSAAYTAIIGGAFYIFTDEERTKKFKCASKNLATKIKPKLDAAGKKMSEGIGSVKNKNIDEIKASLSKNFSDVKDRFTHASDNFANIKDKASKKIDNLKGSARRSNKADIIQDDQASSNDDSSMDKFNVSENKNLS